MADYTTIDDPSVYFQVDLYTGTGSSLANTFDGNSAMQPDLVWIKERNGTADHSLWDSTRGVQKMLEPNTTVAETTESTGLTAFGSDGFTVGALAQVNTSSDTYVAWSWKCNGGTTSSNTDGDLTSTVQVSSTSKLSIFTYTGLDPIEPLDLGHGLGVAPDFFFIKRRNGGSRNWGLYHKNMASTPQNNYLRLNSTNAVATASTWWRNEAPTSSIIKTGEQADVNQPNDTFVCYAWKEVQGYSKFGKYVGTSVADGPFIYLGFQPAFVMIKRLDQGTDYSSWALFDSKRRAYNPAGDTQSLYANRDYAEGKRGEGSSNTSEVRIDILSNGFKVRDGGSDEINDASDGYIYAAFAEHPFVTSTDTNSIPTTAR